METIQTDTTHEQLREAIRSYAFDLKLPLVRRDIDLLIQQALDEQWSMWTFTAELLRREKENRSENQRRHR
ncbi:AAA family ATPase, partial [Muribaculaceae bacterium M3]|nr:AAA family ATPase [Muribaculaceae bacterium M3]